MEHGKCVVEGVVAPAGVGIDCADLGYTQVPHLDQREGVQHGEGRKVGSCCIPDQAERELPDQKLPGVAGRAVDGKVLDRLFGFVGDRLVQQGMQVPAELGTHLAGKGPEPGFATQPNQLLPNLDTAIRCRETTYKSGSRWLLLLIPARLSRTRTSPTRHRRCRAHTPPRPCA